MGRCPAVQWLLLARRLLVAPLGLASRPPSELTEAGLAADGSGSSSSAEGAAAAAVADAARGSTQEREEQAERERRRLGGLLSGGLLPGSWSWWALRCVMGQQHALDGRSHTLLTEASQVGWGGGVRGEE